MLCDVPRRKHPADRLCAFATTLPGAREDMPWEDDLVVKVGKKVFVFFGSPARPPSMGVKLPRSGPYALSLECAEPSGYGLGRSGWVTVHLDRGDTPDTELLHEWILESYRTIAPKKLQSDLPTEGTRKA
ncbi:MAG: MmcQ/YjbR family DNA-binding protein [Candidatus Dormibacteraeota bacterium]|nr:MmcQ/YjbR family DNA-binding protein [Candidatus Dormibacteraeota bacterium]MBV9525092.1 MmcQ/YjbR family DNA-binding protein [Candidatus Dormibacteraeota bacterium]